MARPILVTGCIRSGTTWVGRMIAASPSVGYIHEPFNAWIEKRSGTCSARFRHWYPYVTKANGAAYYAPLRRMLGFRYNLTRAFWESRSWADLKRVWRESGAFREHRRQKVRPLIKDPLAFFSAEWLAETFDMDVIILVRHPAAFAGSMKRLQWDTPFEHLLGQPHLMRDYLQPFEAELRDSASRSPAAVDRAILLWRLVYHVAAAYRRSRGGWLFLRHEDLSKDPVGQFRDMYGRLGLGFSAEVQRTVEEHSDAANPSEVPSNWPFALKRDSRRVVLSWKNRLTEAEIERVREKTWEVAKEFYAEEDW